MHPPLKLTSSYCIRGWHSLVYRHPSGMGQVYQPHPMQDYLHGRWNERWCHKRIMVVQSHNDLPARLPWGGLMGSCHFCCGHLLECPPEIGEDLRLHDVALDLGRDMYVQWNEWHQCPLMLADSEPQDRCNHSPKWVMVGKAKQWGGSEMGKYPSMSGEETSMCLPPWHGILPPTWRRTLTTHRGVASYPPNQNQQRNQNQQPEHKDMLTKGMGVVG